MFRDLIKLYKTAKEIRASPFVSLATNWYFYKTYRKFKFRFKITNLGWKTKYDEYRFEWDPQITITIGKYEIRIVFVPKTNKDILIDCYWEAWLTYKNETDGNLSINERLKQLFNLYSCTWSNYDKNGNKTIIDYYPLILKSKYISLYKNK